MTEPTFFHAGDSVSWSRTLSDYPAPTWTLNYFLIHPSLAKIVLGNAVGVASVHTLTLLAANTAAYAAGEYQLIGRVSGGVDGYVVVDQPLRIKPNLITSTLYDGRTYNQVTLDAIEAVLQNRASLDQESYTIQGRSLMRTPMKDLLALRDYFRNEVILENDAAIVESGGVSQRNITSRF